MRNIDRVREFHQTYKCFIAEKQGFDGVDNNLMFTRFRITREEAEELAHAILMDDRKEMLDAVTDLRYLIDGTFLTFGMENTSIGKRIFINFEGDLEEIDFDLDGVELDGFGFVALIDAALDTMLHAFKNKNLRDMYLCLHGLVFVVDMVAKECKFSPELIEAARVEVHRSNMSKLGADGQPIYNEFGKVMKGPNYFKPDLQALLDKFENDETKGN